jgi:hypothetical protein
MRNPNRYRGSASFDALLSSVPMVLLVVFLMNVSVLLAGESEERMHRQQVFDKLVSVSDYTVKAGAVRRTDGIRYPNWLEPSLITEPYLEDLRNRSSLSALHLSIDGPEDDFPVCIHRFVVVGDDRKVARLFVCGG